MAKTLVIYHGNCADGFGAAWVVRKWWNEETKTIDIKDEIEFFPGVYQTPPPDCKDKNVIIVDFSYKRPVMEKIAEECRTLTWIDHHKSAIADMEDFNWRSRAGLDCYVSTLNSGAMLTWQYFFGSKEPPALLKHIEDRDLWKFALPGTREIQANLFSYPYDFEVWDKLMAKCDSMSELGIFHAEGAAIERKHFKDIHELLNVVTRWMRIGGVEMPVANLPYIHSSDAGHILAESAVNGCAACYWDTPEGRIFSLRSIETGQDVSLIAMQYGGGGHKNAAGFKIDPLRAMEFEISEGGNVNLWTDVAEALYHQ